MRIKVFVDSSVLVAATLSLTGHARDLIRYALADRVQLATSEYVVAEVARNLAAKQPRAAVILGQIIEQVRFDMIDVTVEEVLTAAEYTALKDAPVVAAAAQAKCDFLVTFDRKHLLNPPEVAARSGVAIVTPEVVVRRINVQND